MSRSVIFILSTILILSACSANPDRTESNTFSYLPEEVENIPLQDSSSVPDVASKTISKPNENTSQESEAETLDGSTIDLPSSSSSISEPEETKIETDPSDSPTSEMSLDIPTYDTGLKHTYSDVQPGNPSDALKEYKDENGRDKRFMDTVVTISYKTPYFESETLQLLLESMGTTSLSRLYYSPLEMQPRPEYGYIITLTVYDNDVPFHYYFHENGMIFTEQNGLLYYLGIDTFDTFFYNQIFMGRAFDEITSDIGSVPASLSDFDINDSLGRNDSPLSPLDYIDPEQYEIAVIINSVESETGYQIPLLITNPEYKAEIIAVLNESKELSDYDLFVGSARPDIIRTFNGSGCYNYLAYDDHILDCQQGDNWLVESEDLSDVYRSAAAYECAERLSQ